LELDLMFLKKTPPHSLEAERTVLGGIIVRNENLNTVLSIISPEDFYKDSHRRIIERIISLTDKGLPVDLLSLAEDIQRAGLLEDVGGASYLSALMDGVPKSLNVEYYARIIKEKALLRRLILSSAKIISASYEQKEDADELLNEAQAAIVEVAEQRIKPGFQSMGQLMPPTLEMIKRFTERKEAVTGVPTGLRSLDGMTSGFQPAELVILAARPSMGKTALGLNIAQHVGLQTELAAGFFSMEMAKEQIVIRMLCGEAQLDIKRTRTGFISDREFEKLKMVGEKFARARIFIDDASGLTVMEMKAKCRRLKMEQRLDIVFADYIQLMRTGGRFENRNQEMSYISRSLKEMAKELGIPVVGISQLSRAPEKGRREPKPQLSDLRESGAIEQDADVVLFIFRPEYYHPDDETLKGLAEISIAKQRNGPTGSVTLAFMREHARFYDAELSTPEY
jgi:replicative DNA helicase